MAARADGSAADPGNLGFPGKAGRDAADDGQPMLYWIVREVTRYQTHQCLLLVGTAKTGEWQREDKVWLRMDSGFAIRIERKIEQRSGEFSSQMVVELQSCNPFTTTDSERSARRIEIIQAQRFADMLNELMLPRGEPDRRGYDALIETIDSHVKSRARTPYREAILDLRRRTLLARNGERPPEPVVVTPSPRTATALEEGQAAPDFALASCCCCFAPRQRPPDSYCNLPTTPRRLTRAGPTSWRWRSTGSQAWWCSCGRT